jgi:hypothetical protein
MTVGATDRDPVNIIRRLSDCARSASESLRKYTTDFCNLSVEQQLRLVTAITIVDSTLTIDLLGERIRDQIRIVCPSLEHVDSIFSDLEGWWFGRVVSHLCSGSANLISYQEVHQKMQDIITRYKPSALPLRHRLDRLVGSNEFDPSKRQFVKQLIAIEMYPPRIEWAMRDYYRAYAERTDWVKDNLIFDWSLLDYEQRLEEIWTSTFLKQCNSYRRKIGHALEAFEDVECLEFGTELFDTLMDVDIRIRQDVEEKYIMRGTIHYLADKQHDLVVKWHPRFQPETI